MIGLREEKGARNEIRRRRKTTETETETDKNMVWYFKGGRLIC